MRRRWWMLVAPPAFALFIAAGGAVVWLLWNWLVPSITGWHQVTFWQALGIFALSRILFGGGRGFGGGMRREMGRRMRDRFESMTPEERERFRQGTRGRCGFPPGTSETSSV